MKVIHKILAAIFVVYVTAGIFVAVGFTLLVSHIFG
jgi:hypothetical protein